MLINPTSNLTAPFSKNLGRAAASLGIKFEVLRASNNHEIDAAFARIASLPNSVVMCSPDSFFYTRRRRIAALALRGKVPTSFDVRDYVDAGGLMSYGSDFLYVMARTGNYVGRILKGDKAADLPVEQAKKFELIINSKTATALGIDVPLDMLMTANAVVE